MGVSAKGIQQRSELGRIGIAIEANPQGPCPRLAGELQVADLFGHNPHPPRVLIVRDLALHDQQLVFAQATLVLLVHLRKYRNLKLRRSIIDGRKQHFAATRQLGANAGDHASHPLQIARGLDARQRSVDELLNLLSPGIK